MCSRRNDMERENVELENKERTGKEQLSRQLPQKAGSVLQDGTIASIAFQRKARRRFPFQKLPPELKTKILRLALRDRIPINIFYYYVYGTKLGFRSQGVQELRRSQFRETLYRRWNRKQSYASRKRARCILYASKSIYKEASRVLYGENSFNFQSTTVLAEFLDKIGSAASHLRNVSIGCSYSTHDGYIFSTATRAFQKLCIAESLRTLRICHSSICHPFRRRNVDARDLAKQTTSLLKVLKKSYKMNNLRGDVRDVIQLGCKNGKEKCSSINIRGAMCKCSDPEGKTASFRAAIRQFHSEALDME